MRPRPSFPANHVKNWPNKSLERTTAESAIFHSQMLGGRRSALRSENEANRSVLPGGFDRTPSFLQQRVFLGAATCASKSLGHSRSRSPDEQMTWSSPEKSSRCVCGGLYCREGGRSPNQSLERTTVDRGSFAAHADGGRRSAYRWTQTKTKT